MPLIQIRRSPFKVDGAFMRAIVNALPQAAATILSTQEGGTLKPEDIMVEVDDFGPLDTNCKDIHVRVFAHDYSSRRDRLDQIRKEVAGELLKYLPGDVSWYVWVLLSPTSYGSDTEG